MKLTVNINFETKAVTLFGNDYGRIWIPISHVDNSNGFTQIIFMEVSPREEELAPCPVCGALEQVSVIWEPDLKIKCNSCGIEMPRAYPDSTIDHTSENVLMHRWNALPR